MRWNPNLCLVLLLVSGCAEPADGDMMEESGTSGTSGGGELTCSERWLALLDEGCPEGTSPSVRSGDVMVPEQAEPQFVDFEGGRYRRGDEVVYADESCLIMCGWPGPQDAYCEGVDDTGRVVCGFASNTLTLQECMDFAAACPG